MHSFPMAAVQITRTQWPESTPKSYLTVLEVRSLTRVSWGQNQSLGRAVLQLEGEAGTVPLRFPPLEATYLLRPGLTPPSSKRTAASRVLQTLHPPPAISF